MSECDIMESAARDTHKNSSNYQNRNPSHVELRMKEPYQVTTHLHVQANTSLKSLRPLGPVVSHLCVRV